jgi:hypothetical protein
VRQVARDMPCLVPPPIVSRICTRCVVSSCSSGIGSASACVHWALLAASSSIAVLLAEGDVAADAATAAAAAAAAAVDVPIDSQLILLPQAIFLLPFLYRNPCGGA